MTDLHSLFLISTVVIMPGLIVILLVLVSLAQRETEMNISAFIELFVFQLLFHRRHLFLFEIEDLEIGHAPVHLAKIRFGSDRGAVGFERTLLVTQRFQNVGITHMPMMRPGIQLHGSGISFGAFLLQVSARKSTSQATPGGGASWFQVSGLLKAMDCVHVLGVLQLNHSQVHPGAGKVRRNFHRTP